MASAPPNKTLTVRAEGVDGGATVTPIAGVWIVVHAGASDVVTLEGLHLTALAASRSISGGHLHVVRCVITNGNVSGNAGINFNQTAPAN